DEPGRLRVRPIPPRRPVRDAAAAAPCCGRFPRWPPNLQYRLFRTWPQVSRGRVAMYREPWGGGSFRVRPGAETTMATPADQRLLELLEKWLKSLELHAKYASLDDDSYWKIQPGGEHQRPSRWIIDLALQKTAALRAHIQERVKLGDAKYSDSLELMIFLANLVGSEHIERFIPVAEAQNERPLTREPPGDAARNPADT